VKENATPRFRTQTATPHETVAWLTWSNWKPWLALRRRMKARSAQIRRERECRNTMRSVLFYAAQQAVNAAIANSSTVRPATKAGLMHPVIR
jgi:hypothetical protein